MKRIWAIPIILMLLLMVNSIPTTVCDDVGETPTGLTVEVHNTTRNATGKDWDHR